MPRSTSAGKSANQTNYGRVAQQACRDSDLQRWSVMISLRDQIVYGPVESRRLRRSLGINLLPPAMKVCNMTCAYCQYGWTCRPLRYRGVSVAWPTPDDVDAAVTTRFQR